MMRVAVVHPVRVLTLIVAHVLTASAARAADQAIRFLVDPGLVARADCPVTVVLPDDVADLAKAWVLTELRDGQALATPHQRLGRRREIVAWILGGDTPAKTLRTFELRKAANETPIEPDRKDMVTTSVEPGRVEIRQRDRSVLTYHLSPVAPPDGIDPKYGRSGHIHPVRTPAGEIVSDEFPPDHPHQDGVFLAFPRTEYQGRKPDFWNLVGGTGFVRSRELLEHYDGPVCGGFRVQLEHVELREQAEPQVVLLEEWDVCCWNTAADRNWRFDITSRIRCAAESPLKVTEFSYGGMAFRGARSWTGENVRFTTPEEKTREAGNHSRVPWVDLSGRTGEKTSGITVFTDPANFRFPEPVRLHPTMPYFVFTAAVLGDWTIEPGRTHVSRYRYQVHDGEFRRADAERVWAEISDPPRVAVRVITE